MAAARAVLIEQKHPEWEVGRPHYEIYRRHRKEEIPIWANLDSGSKCGWAKHAERMALLDAGAKSD